MQNVLVSIKTVTVITDVTWIETISVKTELFNNCGVPVIYSNSPQKKFPLLI